MEKIFLESSSSIKKPKKDLCSSYAEVKEKELVQKANEFNLLREDSKFKMELALKEYQLKEREVESRNKGQEQLNRLDLMKHLISNKYSPSKVKGMVDLIIPEESK